MLPAISGLAVSSIGTHFTVTVTYSLIVMLFAWRNCTRWPVLFETSRNCFYCSFYVLQQYRPGVINQRTTILQRCIHQRVVVMHIRGVNWYCGSNVARAIVARVCRRLLSGRVKTEIIMWRTPLGCFVLVWSSNIWVVGSHVRTHIIGHAHEEVNCWTTPTEDTLVEICDSSSEQYSYVHLLRSRSHMLRVHLLRSRNHPLSNVSYVVWTKVWMLECFIDYGNCIRE